MKSPLRELEKNRKQYNDLIKELDVAINNAEDLDVETLEILEGELASIERIVYNIKITLKQLSNKLFTHRAIKDQKTKSMLKDKSSIQFNEVLLYQGKPARAINNLEAKAKKGDPESLYLIGKTYLHGVIGAQGHVYMKDSGLGLKWLHLAYKNGIDDAGYLVGLYEKSVFNVEKAIKIFETLGKKDHLKSLKELTFIYQNDPKYKSMEKLLSVKEKLSVKE